MSDGGIKPSQLFVAGGENSAEPDLECEVPEAFAGSGN